MYQSGRCCYGVPVQFTGRSGRIRIRIGTTVRLQKADKIDSLGEAATGRKIGQLGMHGKARARRWLSRGLVALVLMTGPGCLSFLHPIDPPVNDHVACCKSLSSCCRNHVYIFFIHGLDPLDYANLSGVRDYVQSLGFIKTYYGQLYHTHYFEKELRRIHEEDCDARFVLVGFSFGANMVRNVAQAVKSDGIFIDLLVYLGGNTLENRPKDRPENVGHIVNILATGCIWNGDHLDDATNLNYDDVWHFGSPSHLQTLQVLAEQLAIVAGRVPVAEPEAAATEEASGEWDFLKVRSVAAESVRPTEKH